MANEKNMNPVFSIKNFRSFGEEGADFELAPITVLTGCNSAGKSSLVKALLLLAKQPDGGTSYGLGSPSNIEVKQPSEKLTVSSAELALGRFDRLLNKSSKSKRIELSYTIWSKCLQETIRVRRIFTAHISDAMNNGELYECIVEKFDGTVIFRMSVNSSLLIFEDEINYECVERNFQNFRKACDCTQLQNKLDVEISDGELDNKLDDVEKQAKDAVAFGISNFFIWNRSIKPIRLSKRKNEQKKNEIMKQVYVAMINNEVIRPYFIKDVEYIDSSSANIRRIYTIEDNNKMSNALRKYNDDIAQEQDPVGGGALITIPDFNPSGLFLNKWIKKFGIGDEIKIEGTEEGLGMMVYLVKDGEKRLLADEGYGITQLTSLLLCIDNIIPPFPHPVDEGGVITRWNDELTKDGTIPQYPPKYICVEEPEIHLHPKYQSLLAEMFVEAYQKYNIRFIIETHSEYLIRKLQVMVADKESKLTSNEVSINYVDKDENGISHNRQIKIQEDGRLSEPFGPGFYDEADSLAMDLMKYKARRK